MIPDELNQIAEIIGKRLALCHKEVLTLEEASQYSGLALSTLYKLTSTRVLPHSKPTGKYCFIKRADLEEWLMGSPIATAAELDGKAFLYCRNHK